VLILLKFRTVFRTGKPSFFSPAMMKRKTKIPRKVWEFICTAAIIACLALAAAALFKSFR